MSELLSCLLESSVKFQRWQSFGMALYVIGTFNTISVAMYTLCGFCRVLSMLAKRHHMYLISMFSPLYN